MKIITTLALSSFLFTSLAGAKTSVYTSLNTSGKDVFAGVKVEEKGMEPETYLLHVDSSLKSEKVTLPKELSHREIIALFPTTKSSLLVLTQRTVEQGDDPQLHAFNPQKKEWKKLGEVECMTFSKVNLEKNALILSCVETTEKGEEVVKEKAISFKDLSLSQTGKVILPVTEVKGDIDAKLLGDAFYWQELKVELNKKSKVIRP